MKLRVRLGTSSLSGPRDFSPPGSPVPVGAEGTSPGSSGGPPPNRWGQQTSPAVSLFEPKRGNVALKRGAWWHHRGCCEKRGAPREPSAALGLLPLLLVGRRLKKFGSRCTLISDHDMGYKPFGVSLRLWCGRVALSAAVRDVTAGQVCESAAALGRFPQG